MKTFNTLSNAMSTSTAENGTPDAWGYSDEDDNEQEIIEKYILPYLSVSKKITEDDTEYNYPVSQVNGKKYETVLDTKHGTTRDVYYNSEWTEGGSYVLNDGSIVQAGIFDDGQILISFDTNGLKGPNAWGRDIFIEGYCYYKTTGNKYISIPCSMLECPPYEECTLKSREELEEEFISDDSEYSCTSDNFGGAFNCASRLMLHGKMDY